MSGGGHHSCDFYDVISIENLFSAWKEFRKGKRSKKDVALFELNLEDNIFKLHDDLETGTWKPDPYVIFYVQDPKLRKIHKATVRDRVLYQAVYRILYHIFDPSFVHDSYSSRNYKGTHAGVRRFEVFSRKVSRNFTLPAFVLKCDIRKFFDSIDHFSLAQLILEKITDEKLISLIVKIIDSFHCEAGRGLPLGNVTSQLFANVYMNELDQFIKHTLKANYYIRYCDDFVILDSSHAQLKGHIIKLTQFLNEKLGLKLHPRKVEIRKIRQGIDFLGYVSLPHYQILRTSTKRRMFKKIQRAKEMLNAGVLSSERFNQIVASYYGVLSHCKSRNIQDQIQKLTQ